MKSHTQTKQENTLEKNKEPIAIRLEIPRHSKPVSKTSHTRTIELSPDKIPIEKLRAIWNDKEVTYTDDELYKIRSWLYTIADVTIGVYNDCKAAEHANSLHTQLAPQLINLTSNHHHTHEAEESHSLRPGIYRRAS